MVSGSAPGVRVPMELVWGGRGVSRLGRASGGSLKTDFPHLCALTLRWAELPVLLD